MAENGPFGGGHLKKEKWSKTIDFLFVTVGSSVGLGNVWRFPYVCYRNGGGVFLIPYFVAVLVIGLPLSFLEAGLGQFMSQGAITAWKISPLFQGLGCTLAVFAMYSSCTYNVVMSWVLYYLFASFNPELPWSHCNNEWNTKHCREHLSDTTHWNISNNNNNNNTSIPAAVNFTTYALIGNSSTNFTHRIMDASTEFWERKVLDISDGIDDMGSVKWDLALCLLLAWVIVYLSIWKGIKVTGKISYFTVTLPYLLLLVLLVRGALLEGSLQGIQFYLQPDWTKLGDPQIWLEAGIQVFYSNSLAVSLHTALASCNKFHHNSLRHLLAFTVINSLTSFLSGFVIFSVLGFMALRENVSVSQVAGSGPGLAFVVYPEALSQMPVAQLWAILFFTTLVLLGIDSQFGLCEAMVINLSDIFPGLLRRSPHKEVSIAIMCSVCFLCGLPMVTQGGVYIEQLMEWYCQGRIRLLVGFGECAIIAWVYGVSRFHSNLEYMLGYRLNPFFKVTWCGISPIVCLAMFVITVILLPELTYKRKSGVYYFPSSARAAGWVFAALPLLCVPVMMLWRIYNTGGPLLSRIKFLRRLDVTQFQEKRDGRLESDGKDISEEDVPLN